MPYQFKDYQKTEILTDHLNMGGKSPDGKAWIGVMGEYHFVRDSRDHWYCELCKMGADGITVDATYLFWIYHEETEGDFDFTGDRDIRRFILDAQRAGLDVFIRIGTMWHKFMLTVSLWRIIFIMADRGAFQQNCSMAGRVIW